MVSDSLTSKEKVSDIELRILIQGLEAFNEKSLSISQKWQLSALRELLERRASSEPCAHHLPKQSPWCPLCNPDKTVPELNRAAQPPKARYGIPEALTYLKERAEWLDREMRNGGNVEYLSRRYEECRYIASCIEDTFVRLTEADRQSSTKPEQCPCWDSWRTNYQWLANCRAKQQGAPVETSDGSCPQCRFTHAGDEPCQL